MDIVPIIFVFVVVIGVTAYIRWGGVIKTNATLAYFDSAQIVLRLKNGLYRRILWEDVIAIFTSFSQKPMKYWHSFAFELSKGEYVGFRIEQVESFSDANECDSFRKRIRSLLYDIGERRKRAHVEDALERLYDCFAENLRRREINIETFTFSHPTAWIKGRNRSLNTTYGFYGLSFLFMTVIGRDLSGWGPIYFSGLFAILAFAGVSITSFLARHRKGLVSLRVQGNEFMWLDEHGQSGTANTTELRAYCLHKTMSFVEFRDRTTLRELEKLRYWPLLREYLIERIECIGDS